MFWRFFLILPFLIILFNLNFLFELFLQWPLFFYRSFRLFKCNLSLFFLIFFNFLNTFFIIFNKLYFLNTLLLCRVLIHYNFIDFELRGKFLYITSLFNKTVFILNFFRRFLLVIFCLHLWYFTFFLDRFRFFFIIDIFYTFNKIFLFFYWIYARFWLSFLHEFIFSNFFIFFNLKFNFLWKFWSRFIALIISFILLINFLVIICADTWLIDSNILLRNF